MQALKSVCVLIKSGCVFWPAGLAGLGTHHHQVWLQFDRQAPPGGGREVVVPITAPTTMDTILKNG